MDGRRDADHLAPIGPVEPVMHGRGLALPPLPVIVGVAGILIGLVAGFGLAPRTVPAATASPPAATASPTDATSPRPLVVVLPGDTAAPVGNTSEVPLGGGISLAQILKAWDSAVLPASPNDVVSARLAHWSEVAPSWPGVTDQWVWVISVNSWLQCTQTDGGVWVDLPGLGVSPVPVASPLSGSSAGPSAQAYGCAYSSQQAFIFDYETGAFLGSPPS
jgi:hypothetical protein